MYTYLLVFWVREKCTWMYNKYACNYGDVGIHVAVETTYEFETKFAGYGFRTLAQLTTADLNTAMRLKQTFLSFANFL